MSLSPDKCPASTLVLMWQQEVTEVPIQLEVAGLFRMESLISSNARALKCWGRVESA